MKTDRLLLVLVTLTALTQAIVLFRQVTGSAGKGGINPEWQAESREPIRDAPPNSMLEVAGLPTRGSDKAKIFLIEFSDYECPFCARHATGVGEQLKRDFIDTGKIRHAFANNPLPIHPNSKLLASAAFCSGEQGKYWEMHDVLFATKPKRNEEILALASGLSLNVTQFQQCLESSKEAAKRIEVDSETAKNLGLRATPAFALGRVNATGQVEVEKLIIGAVPLKYFQEAINDYF